MLNAFLFYISIIFILFLPGYFLLFAIFGKGKMNELEKFCASVGLSIGIINIILIFLDKGGIIISRTSVIISIALFLGICFLIYYFKQKKIKEEKNFDFTKTQILAIITILLLSFFLRTIYLSNTVSPTATDLAHHMYWTKKIITDGKIPPYQKTDIVQNDAGNYEISQPQNISDFIVGEHLIFSAIFLVSGINVMSEYPVLILFIINIFGILALFILALRLFESFSFGKNAAIMTLFLIGPLYAFSSSQSNFVSGGVIGNLMGNLLIPLSIYFVYRAIAEKNAIFLTISAFSIFSIAYIHHLSAFIFLFIIAFTLIFLFIFSRRNFLREIKILLKIIFSWPMISFLVLAGLFFLFIFTPSYIANQAVKTIIGEPSRITKEGLNIDQIRFVVGDPRFVVGVLGFFLVLFFHKKSLYLSTILSGWFVSIFLLCWKPQLFKIDIPSVRIGTYVIYPLIILGAFFIAWIFNYLQNTTKEKFYLKVSFLRAFFLLFFIFLLAGGFSDDAKSLKTSVGEYLKTFNIAQYLSGQVNQNDLVIKDHNYISSDSWMKLFFMRDYNFPLTRSLFFRYEGDPKREMCTYWMISMPEGAEAQKCFSDTGTDFVVVDPVFDGGQFNKSSKFSKVYATDSLVGYYKNK